MRIKNFGVFYLLCLLQCSYAQRTGSLSLQECHQMALRSHPLQKQYDILEKTSKLRVTTVEASKFPDLTWQSRARIQSDVVEFPLDFPGINIPKLPLYGLQSTIEANWIIRDGGMRNALTALEEVSLPIEKLTLDVELDKIKPQINELFFGILAQREKIEVLKSGLTFLSAKLDVAQKAIGLGSARSGDADRLKIEILQVQNRISEAQLEVDALLKALSEWIQMPLDENTVLYLPNAPNHAHSSSLMHLLFDAKKQKLLISESLLDAQKKPRIALFGQMGLGYPNPFNFFDNSLRPFAALGLTFSRQIFDWNKSQRDRELIRLQIRSLENQKSAFDLHNQIKERQIQKQISDLGQIEIRDSEILEIHGRLLEQTEREWALGTITAMEVIEQSQYVTQAQLQLKNRALQRKIWQIALWTIQGKL